MITFPFTEIHLQPSKEENEHRKRRLSLGEDTVTLFQS